MTTPILATLAFVLLMFIIIAGLSRRQLMQRKVIKEDTASKSSEESDETSTDIETDTESIKLARRTLYPIGENTENVDFTETVEATEIDTPPVWGSELAFEYPERSSALEAAMERLR